MRIDRNSSVSVFCFFPHGWINQTYTDCIGCFVFAPSSRNCSWIQSRGIEPQQLRSLWVKILYGIMVVWRWLVLAVLGGRPVQYCSVLMIFHIFKASCFILRLNNFVAIIVSTNRHLTKCKRLANFVQVTICSPIYLSFSAMWCTVYNFQGL